MELDRLIQRAPEALAPQHDLWPGIQARLQGAPRRPAPWALAASLLLGLLIGSQLRPFWPSETVPTVSTERLLDLLERQHRQRLASLAQPLQPSLQTASADLTLLRDASKELRQALRDQPDNLALLDLLLWTQQRELELTQQHHQTQQAYQPL